MDSTTYRPSPDVLKRLEHVTLAAVVGPTAAGKTVLIREAVRRDPSLHLVLNNTSRAPRPDEQDGVDYRFETRARMEERMARHEFVQVAPNLFGDIYATAAEDYPTGGVCLMPVLADAMPTFRALPFKTVRCIFVLPPDWETWQTRIKEHQFNADKLMQRLNEAKRSLRYAQDDNDTQFVICRSVADSVDDFMMLAYGRPLNEQREADQKKAPQIVRDLLNRLEQATRDPAMLV